MSNKVMLLPIHSKVEIQKVTIGFLNTLRKKNIKLNLFQLNQDNIYLFNILKRFEQFNVNIIQSISYNFLKKTIHTKGINNLLNKITTNYFKNIDSTRLTIIEGLVPEKKNDIANIINCKIASILNAEVILISFTENNLIKKVKKQIEFFLSYFHNAKLHNISVIVMNQIGCCNFKENLFYYEKSKKLITKKIFINKNKFSTLKQITNIPLIGYLDEEYISNDIFKMQDILYYLKAKKLIQNHLHKYLIKKILFCSQINNKILNKIKNYSLIILSSRNKKFLLKFFMKIQDKIQICTILITDEREFPLYIKCLIEQKKIKRNISVFYVNLSIFQIFMKIKNLYKNFKEIQNNSNLEKFNILKYINLDWLNSLIKKYKSHPRIGSYEFRYKLLELASQLNKVIVLPEGYESRTIQAASICSIKKIAHCILLGNPKDIFYIANKQGIKIDKNIEIINPEKIRNNYLEYFIEIRKNKGINEHIANEQLKDNVILGTLMLHKNEVDGLVSGAEHTTANTIKPALQIIKTSTGYSIISSIFFMLFSHKVMIYGDCAVNINPNVEQLAEIAIQSAKSALNFGINPIIAMISYSTGNSGTGKDVEKVKEATLIVKNKYPNFIIDGPLQYDAAVIPEVALIKAPNSPVAGKANVIIFPDLNTGNTTYKAVQRSSSNVLAIGPMLQGIRKPVNDLSRGATVEDIVYTIALTAIQSNYL